MCWVENNHVTPKGVSDIHGRMTTKHSTSTRWLARVAGDSM